MAAASDTLKRVFLELGGKSAAIVLDDADFNTAALFSRVHDGDPRRPGLRADVAAAGAAQAPRRDRRADQEQLRPGALRRPDRPEDLHGPADQREAARQGRRHGQARRRGRRHAGHRRREGRPRATSIPRRCSPTSTPTARSPRRRCSGRCSSSSPTTTTTTRCASPTTRSTGCPARCSAARTARWPWPGGSAPARSPSTAATTSAPTARSAATSSRASAGRWARPGSRSSWSARPSRRWSVAGAAS